MSKFFKQSEFAPGIPEKGAQIDIPKSSKLQQWEFVVQEHLADVRGKHLDLRLAPPMGPGLSWVVQELPKPGQKTYAIRTSDHSPKYFDFKGVIKEGYGKGTVKQIYRGKVDVISSDKNKITFYWYGPSGTELHKYTLFNPYGDNKWLFLNHTKTAKLETQKKIKPLVYKDVSKSYNKLPSDFETPKIDGASSLVVLLGGKTPAVFSKRTSKKTNDLIEYTPKIPKLLDNKVPKDFGTTVLRAEVFALDKNNEELPNRLLGGLLNSGVQKSRDAQKKLGAPLRLAAFDVVKYKGKNVSNLPIKDKYKIIQEISSKYPYIEDPLQLNKTTSFKEGKVIWRDNKPYKVKYKQDFDVYVRDVFPSTKKGFAGGILYSYTPNGPIVGKVGTGWTHEELKDMYNNSKNYVGRIARVKAQEKHPSGALRAPSFVSWHLDKNL